ncbi:MAG: NAD(+) kinase [Candidatus Dasytiphilus stammeri]
MKKKFQRIGIIGIPRIISALVTHTKICKWLKSEGYQVFVEKKIARDLKIPNIKISSIEEIGQKADLAIVVGGDGNMLGAARVLAQYNISVIGINRGNLGFLTDLSPINFQNQLEDVLKGNYIRENRFLLEAKVYCKRQQQFSMALNEIILHTGKVAHMFEFEVYIDEKFAFSHRSDGLIIATPTGSTAYSLSAGGAILVPTIEAITLVPMFPHTLSSRPLVIHSSSNILLRVSAYMNKSLKVSCDSQIILPVYKGQDILIRRSKSRLHLIHPKNYNYFNILSNKLGWLKKFF